MQEARQVFAVRRMLEAGMTREFVANVTPARIKALREHVALEKAAVVRADVSDRTELLGDFHVRMAELMGNSGSITACDIHPHRLELIEAAMKRTGVRIVRTEERDSSAYVPEYAESFDHVLADVPCSGLGVIAGKPEIKLTSDPSAYGELIKTQSLILGNALSYARPGGRVEYSTCTLNKNENENVVKHILSKTGSSARIIEMETLLPYNGKVGFFYSIIEKTAN
jgi:16S rRNA (cytosine967-C5)-methyltransferase